jgi:hypothetical protein
MTGYSNPDLLARCKGQAELSSCLVKPVRASDLRKAVNQALAR